VLTLAAGRGPANAGPRRSTQRSVSASAVRLRPWCHPDTIPSAMGRMMRMPERITSAWIDGLTDSDLVTAESRLHRTFSALERAQKKLLGGRYDLMRAPADLLAAWGSWSRVSTAARARGLHVRRGVRRA
jgi:hypothetical protein